MSPAHFSLRVLTFWRGKFRNNPFRSLFVLFVVTFLPALAFAQTAAEMDALLETEAVSVSAAARFTLGSVELLPQGLSGGEAESAAYGAALSRGWVKGAPEDAITLQEAAYLIMKAFELKGGIMYSLLQSPRYAYREMIYRKLIQGRNYANMQVSGWRFLQIIGRALNYAGERELMDELMINASGASYSEGLN